MILLITYYKYNLRKKVIVFFLNLLRIKENDNFLYMPIVNVPVFKTSAPRKNQTVNFLKILKFSVNYMLKNKSLPL